MECKQEDRVTTFENMLEPFKGRCLVCWEQQTDPYEAKYTSDIVETSNGNTVKECIERVLGIELDSTRETLICNRCYCDLVQIELYYSLVKSFKKRYEYGTELHREEEKAMCEQNNEESHKNCQDDIYSDILNTNQTRVLGVNFEGNKSDFEMKDQQHLKDSSSIASLDKDCSNHVDKWQEYELKFGDILQRITSVPEFSSNSLIKDPEGGPRKIKQEKGTEDTSADQSHTGADDSTHSYRSMECKTETSIRPYVNTHIGSSPHIPKVHIQSFEKEKTVSVDTGMDLGQHGAKDAEELLNRSASTQRVKVKQEDCDCGDPSRHVSEKNSIHECDICHIKFDKERDLGLHKKYAHGKYAHLSAPKFECAECKKQFWDQRQLKIHVKTHERKKNVKIEKCHLCKAKYSDAEELDKHLAVCTGVRNQCPLCAKIFDSPSVLRVHLRIHTGETPYHCQYCPRKFKDKGNFNAHVRIHTGDAKYKCDLCDKRFIHHAQRRIHELTHKKNPPFVCETCGKGFFWPNAYKKHITIHTSSLTHLCSFCGKGFKEQSMLKRHMVVHSDDRPYKCAYCDKTFKLLKYKKTHERVHTGEKPYECDECGRGFSQYTGLKVHSKTHDSAPAVIHIKGALSKGQ